MTSSRIKPEEKGKAPRAVVAARLVGAAQRWQGLAEYNARNGKSAEADDERQLARRIMAAVVVLRTDAYVERGIDDRFCQARFGKSSPEIVADIEAQLGGKLPGPIEHVETPAARRKRRARSGE